MPVMPGQQALLKTPTEFRSVGFFVNGAPALHENEQRNRRVASVLRGLNGTERERLILKGFRRYRAQHGFLGKGQR
jgi:hypothetical protein